MSDQTPPVPDLAVSCPHCGCTFRRPQDSLTHCCAAMQLACEDGLGHDFKDAGGGLELCLSCGVERWAS